MNRFALIGAALAVLVCGAVALAASPLPSASPGGSTLASPGASAMASPDVSTTPTASPSVSPSASPSLAPTSGSRSQRAASQARTWAADVNPVNIQGTATVTRNADGTGTLLLQLTGMVNEQSWTIDVEPGYVQHPNAANTIAFKQGSEVTRIAPDKIQVTLTKIEMQDYDHALSANPGGVTVFVSDGHRLSAANIPATAQ